MGDEETDSAFDEAGWPITGRCLKRIDAQMSLDEKARGTLLLIIASA